MIFGSTVTGSTVFGAEGSGPRRSDVRSVATIAGYAALAGTAVGLVTYPLTKSSRGIFIGTSVGLYLGIAVGLYHIAHRDDPENPFSSEFAPTQAPNGTFALVSDFGVEKMRTPAEPALFYTSYPFLRF